MYQRNVEISSPQVLTERDLFFEFQRSLEGFEENIIILLIVPTNIYHAVRIELLKFLCNYKGRCGIYISVTSPYDSLYSMLEKNNVGTEKLFFIDVISASIGEVEETENCLYVHSPNSLTEISITLGALIENAELLDRFIVVDSVTTLLVHNEPARVSRFFHFLITKMKRVKMGGVLLSTREETDKRVLNELSLFCDKVIKIGGV